LQTLATQCEQAKALIEDNNHTVTVTEKDLEEQKDDQEGIGIQASMHMG
jgi:hypothetical protein